MGPNAFWRHADSSVIGETGDWGPDTRGQANNRRCIHIDGDEFIPEGTEPAAPVDMNVLRGRWVVPKYYCRHGIANDEPFTDGTDSQMPSVYYPSPPKECCNPYKVAACQEDPADPPGPLRTDWNLNHPDDPCVKEQTYTRMTDGADTPLDPSDDKFSDFRVETNTGTDCISYASNPHGDCGLNHNDEPQGPCIASDQYQHHRFCADGQPPRFDGTCADTGTELADNAGWVDTLHGVTVTYDANIICDSAGNNCAGGLKTTQGGTVEIREGMVPFLDRFGDAKVRDYQYDEWWFNMDPEWNPNQYQTCYNLDYAKLEQQGLMCEDMISQCSCGGTGVNEAVCMVSTEDCDKAWNLYNVEGLEEYPFPENSGIYQRGWEEYVCKYEDCRDGLTKLTATAQEKANLGVGTTWTSSLVDWSNNPLPHPPSDITEENFGTVPSGDRVSDDPEAYGDCSLAAWRAYNEDPNNNPFDSMATRISRGLSSKCPNPYFGTVYSNDGRAMCLMEEKRVAYCPCKKHYGFHGDAPYQDGMGRCAFDRSMTGLNPGAPGFPDNTVYQRLRFINNGLVICMEPQGHAILAPNHTYASRLFQPSPPPSPGAANLPQRRLAVPRRTIRASGRAGGGPQPTRHQLQSARAHHQRVGGPLSRRVLREPRVPSRVRAAGVPPEPHHGHPNSRAGGNSVPMCKWQGQCTSGDGYIGSYGGGEFNGWLDVQCDCTGIPEDICPEVKYGCLGVGDAHAARAAPPAALALAAAALCSTRETAALAAAGQSLFRPLHRRRRRRDRRRRHSHPAPAAAPRSSTRGRSALRNSRSRACAQTQAATVPAGNGFLETYYGTDAEENARLPTRS